MFLASVRFNQIHTTEAAVLPDPHETPTLRVREAAEVLGVSRATVYEAVRTGQLPNIRLGTLVLVPTAALLRMLSVEPTEDGSEKTFPSGRRVVPLKKPMRPDASD